MRQGGEKESGGRGKDAIGEDQLSDLGFPLVFTTRSARQCEWPFREARHCRGARQSPTQKGGSTRCPRPASEISTTLAGDFHAPQAVMAFRANNFRPRLPTPPRSAGRAELFHARARGSRARPSLARGRRGTERGASERGVKVFGVLFFCLFSIFAPTCRSIPVGCTSPAPRRPRSQSGSKRGVGVVNVWRSPSLTKCLRTPVVPTSNKPWGRRAEA
jgi:hypothetical protein